MFPYRPTAYLFLALVSFSFFLPATRAQVNVTNEIVVADTVLVWEAKTYVPPFYKGKALLPDGGDMRILAFPPTELGNPRELSYTWKVEGTVMQDSSGPGRSFFTHESDMFGGSPLIVVDVLRDGKRVSVGVLRAPLVLPRVLTYPSLPLGGILFGNQVNAVRGAEITLEAYPLFFSVGSKSDPALIYQWALGGSPAENPLGNSGRLVVRSESGGDAALALTVYNERNLLETASDTITLTFEE